MASGTPQRTYWPVPPNWPYDQYHQFQNNDMSSGENMVRNVRGISETEKYGEISDPTVEVTALAAVP